MPQSNRRDFLQTTAAGLTLGATGQLYAGADESKSAADRLRVIVLEGTPHERGLTHGKTLKEPIRALVKLWKADLAERYKMEADAFIAKFLRYTDYQPAMNKWTPELLEEIRGIAQGAGIDFNTMLVFQLIDEYWVNGPGAAGEHCTSLGVSRRGADRPSIVAQNMDLEGFRDGFQTVLRIKYPNSKREALVLTHAGLIGLNGLNNRGIGICCNTLTQLTNCRDGLPVACVVRGVLERETLDAALFFLTGPFKHASGQNYIVGSPTQVFDYECAADQLIRFTPVGETDRVWHTNHPLANDSYTPAYRKALEEKKTEKKADNSATRFQAVEKRMGAAGTVTGLELIQATLAAKDSAEHPICRPHKSKKDNFTFASTIMVLAEKPELHITAGPPEGQAYQRLTFSVGK